MSKVEKLTLIAGEEVIRKMRPHWIVLILPTVALIILTTMYVWLMGLISNLPEPFKTIVVWVVSLIMFALFLRWVAKGLIWWATTKYLFTNKRIVTRSGLIRVTGETIALNKVQSIQFEKTLLERLVGSGSLIIESASENSIRIIYVWDAERIQQEVYAQINKLEEDGNNRNNSGL